MMAGRLPLVIPWAMTNMLSGPGAMVRAIEAPRKYRNVERVIPSSVSLWSARDTFAGENTSLLIARPGVKINGAKPCGCCAAGGAEKQKNPAWAGFFCSLFKGRLFFLGSNAVLECFTGAEFGHLGGSNLDLFACLGIAARACLTG